MSAFDPKAFGRKLRSAREEAELTQMELSIRSTSIDNPDDRISAPYISALERGDRETRPSDPFLEAIARGLRHKDSWEVREWAGQEKAPDWSTTLRAIQKDDALLPGDRELMRRVYMRLIGQS